MPKTRHFSDCQKRYAMNLLNIHDDFSAVPPCLQDQRTRRRWQKKLRRQQKATLAEKSFSLADIPTKPAKVKTNQKLYDNSAPTPDAPIQPPANANAARNDSHNANNDRSGEYH